MKLPTIPPPYIGWALCLSTACALALTVWAVLDIRSTAQERRRYIAAAAAAARYLDSLKALHLVPVEPGASVRVFPAPRPDTLKRAVR